MATLRANQQRAFGTFHDVHRAGAAGGTGHLKRRRSVSGTGVLTVDLDLSGAAGKITFDASCGGAGATDLGCAWILFEPDSGTGYRLGGAFLNKAGVDSGTVSSGDLPQPFSTLLGPMNVRVTLIDNAGNRSNSVVVPVAHWFQW